MRKNLIDNENKLRYTILRRVVRFCTCVSQVLRKMVGRFALFTILISLDDIVYAA